MTVQPKGYLVQCRDCEKDIGIYDGDGQVIGICTPCYEALH